MITLPSNTSKINQTANVSKPFQHTPKYTPSSCLFKVFNSKYNALLYHIGPSQCKAYRKEASSRTFGRKDWKRVRRIIDRAGSRKIYCLDSRPVRLSHFIGGKSMACKEFPVSAYRGKYRVLCILQNRLSHVHP